MKTVGIMKVVGFILLFGSIIGAIILLVNGIKEKEYTTIPISIAAAVFGVCTSLAIVYAADVPQTFDIAFEAKRSTTSNSKSIIRMSDEIKTLQNQVKELKEIIKNIQK